MSVSRQRRGAPRPGARGTREPLGEPGVPGRAGLRRRLRHLRTVRELQLRDLGGLVFDLHRFRKERHNLVLEKLSALRATDAEMRSLEQAMGEPRSTRELREPGIGGMCPSCRAYYASDARFCASCGIRVGDAPAESFVSAPPVAVAEGDEHEAESEHEAEFEDESEFEDEAEPEDDAQSEDEPERGGES